METGSKLLETGSKLILIEKGTIFMNNIKINGIPISNESMKNTPFLHCISSFFEGTSHKNL